MSITVEIPEQAGVSFKFEISAKAKITSFYASPFECGIVA
jgi:hypothetical protein